MLPKQNRLTKKNDFNSVFKKGISSFDANLGIKILKNNLPYSRYGVIVSNKISKKATERNKIKRRIKEILSKEKQGINLNIDCVIIALPPIKNSKFTEIKKSIEKNLTVINKKIKYK